MAKTTTLPLTQTIKATGTTIALAQTTALQTVATAGADDAVIKGITITSNDTATMNVALSVTNGSTTTAYLIGTINVPAASGTNGSTVGIDGLNATLIPGLPMDATGRRYIPLPANALLKANVLANVTSGKIVTITAFQENY